MINLLIYGTGYVYIQLKKILNWKEIKLIAFLESKISKEFFEGYPVYTPEYVIKEGKQKFDYILCASTYEHEMRESLEQLQVPENKIVSGEMSVDNYLRYSDIFDISKIIVQQNEKIVCQNKELITNIKKMISQNRFRDEKAGICWMKDLSIVAGKWAVSYDYMYVMLRILQIKKPEKILEMGLGQSSKILVRYQEYTDCHYDVVEQSADWYKIFKDENGLPDKMKVHIKPVKTVYNEKYDADVICYTDFEEVVNNKKYDFISIDGPWGSDKISRIDILPYVERCLETSFCIMIDDYERDGEKNLVLELEDILRKNQIKYHKAIYGMYKIFCLLVSDDNLFLCDL